MKHVVIENMPRSKCRPKAWYVSPLICTIDDDIHVYATKAEAVKQAPGNSYIGWLWNRNHDNFQMLSRGSKRNIIYHC